ncbi:DUF4421 family protein [Gaetbulibacter aquiaggeris]|uniref:DUF4421 family protein n=1 Tax=Gaetbulibacter aquiaggeris TaxID=1735373 RepID=A0ABW7MJW1_9FLAO
MDTILVLTEDNYIEKMSNQLAMDISLNNSYEIFEVKTPNNKSILYPNTPTNLRLKLNYRFISFGFQFSPDFLPGNGDENIKGETKSFEIGTSLIFKHWFVDASYSKVKGYYLYNSEDYGTLLPGDPYFQFPDLHYSGFKVASGYLSNSKFSLRSLTIQTERQLKSVGSFIPVFNLSFYTIDDKSDGTSTQKSNNIETTVGPGYAYTFIVKENFYMSLGLSGSIGYLNSKITTRSVSESVLTKQDNFIFRWEGKVGMGYNGNRFYTGLYGNISGTQYEQQNTSVMNFDNRVSYHLFFGMRFQPPDYLNRKVNKIEDKLNL